MSVPDPAPATGSTVMVKHRVLTGLAVAPLTFAALGAAGGPVNAASGVRVTTLPAQGGGGIAARDAPIRATTATDPAKRTSDSVGLLAGGMVAAASAAFAGTGVVRKRKMRR